MLDGGHGILGLESTGDREGLGSLGAFLCSCFPWGVRTDGRELGRAFLKQTSPYFLLNKTGQNRRQF